MAQAETAVRTIKNYIGGGWVDAEASESLDVTNPASGETLAQLPMSSRADLDRAVEAARQAFPAWRATSPVERARACFRLKNALEERRDELAEIVSRDNGKAIKDAAGEVRREVAQQHVDHLHGAAARAVEPRSVVLRALDRLVLEVAVRVVAVGSPHAVGERRESALGEHAHHHRGPRARRAGDDRDEVARHSSSLPPVRSMRSLRIASRMPDTRTAPSIELSKRNVT